MAECCRKGGCSFTAVSSHASLRCHRMPHCGVITCFTAVSSHASLRCHRMSHCRGASCFVYVTLFASYMRHCLPRICDVVYLVYATLLALHIRRCQPRICDAPLIRREQSPLNLFQTFLYYIFAVNNPETKTQYETSKSFAYVSSYDIGLLRRNKECRRARRIDAYPSLRHQD